MGGCTSGSGVQGRTRRRASKHCTKIDEDEMKESWLLGLPGGRALSCVVSEVVSALVHFGNRCCERQKEGFCPKPLRRWTKVWVPRYYTVAGAVPCTPSCHIWHATQAVTPYSNTIPCPFSRLLAYLRADGACLGYLREISPNAKPSQMWLILHHPETASCRERPRKLKEGGEDNVAERHAGCRRAEREKKKKKKLCLHVPC